MLKNIQVEPTAGRGECSSLMLSMTVLMSDASRAASSSEIMAGLSRSL